MTHQVNGPQGLNHKSLDSLELYELLVAAYPEKFDEEKDGDIWQEVLDFADELSGYDDIADLLGRIVMLSTPTVSPLSGGARHCLGKVTIENGTVSMLAAVTREVANG